LTAEFGDVAPVRSNVTRAYHLLARSGLSCDEFLQRVAEARAITLARRGRITKRCVGADNVMRTNMMPYWFSVLMSLLEQQPADQHRNAALITDEPGVHPIAPHHLMIGAAATNPPGMGRMCVERQNRDAQEDPVQCCDMLDERSHHGLWQRLLAELRCMLAPTAYARCLAGVVRSEHGMVVRIEACDPMQLCWYETRLRRPIEAALADLGQVGLRVVFSLPGTDRE
jgi:hypothetical protein